MKIVLSILILLATLQTYGQDATALLKEVSTKVRSYENVRIEFKYNLNNQKEGVNQDTNGDVTLSGDNYILNMLGITRMFDGTSIYTIVPEDEEVTISSFNSEDEKDITPSEMLTFYEAGYDSRMGLVETINGRKIQFVKLTPIDSDAEIKKIYLGIDKKTKHIYKLIQIDGKGTKYTLTVKSFKTNLPLSKTLFIFDEATYANKGYYINTLD
ncbi:MAG: outer membrane lipoprotein-sorting protein [Candidatus Paceibacteria bacterium]|jgi:outer membrane lipoprotein-sorting protein